MHQNQWMAVLEEQKDMARSSVDSKGEFGVREAEPMGEVPKLAPRRGTS